MMLEAMIGRELLEDSYRAALVQGYRWHEFGDVHLIVP
jgi:S-adenosylmethionine:tRNA ribosyltransferase-isomerase